jgi:hypothetical protein
MRPTKTELQCPRQLKNSEDNSFVCVCPMEADL